MSIAPALVPTRGERNNNPGNLRDFNIPWVGRTGKDEHGMTTFDTPENGIRALAKDVIHDYAYEGHRTIRLLINEYAPPSENNTSAYITDVAKRCDLDPNQGFDLSIPTLCQIVKAIILHENGRVIYDDEVILTAVRSTGWMQST